MSEREDTARIVGLIDRLSECLEHSEGAGGDAPYESLSPTLVQRAERDSGIAFDEELRAFFAALGGKGRGLSVVVTTDEVTVCETVSLNEALECRPRKPLPWSKPFHYRGRLVSPDARVQPFLAHPKWLPLAECNGGSTTVFFDGAPAASGRHGQIIAYQHDPDAVYWIASSVAALLEQSIAHFEEHGLSDADPELEETADASPPPFAGPSRNGSCVCAKFRSGPLDTGALWERVTHTPDIKASFERVAHHAATATSLYRCVACGASWQGSGGEDPRRAYVQHVLEIGVAAWLEEPYQQAWEVALYATARQAWLSTQAPGSGTCRVAGCEKKTIRYSLECLDHALAVEHERGTLRVPVGRAWPG